MHDPSTAATATLSDAATQRVRVVAAVPGDWARMRALRLAALADTPDAFSATLAEEREQPDAFWRGRMEKPEVTTLRAELRADDGTWRDVGLAVVAPSFDARSLAGIYSVWVAPDARGCGAGDALIAAAVAHAAAAGFGRVVLDVGDHNAAAIRLYERAGFRATGRTLRLPPPREHLTEHELALDLAR